ncbi:flavin reductase family protein [Sphingorhabdus arenilitoris]|uniref:Flavin reductase family protein n=1 Tax=Sphingorhabdus arenilitoris TaxID=1490041 RepID=A0ABV8RJ56_9SPHN
MTILNDDRPDAANEKAQLAADMLQGLRRFAKSVMVISCECDGRRYAMSATAVSEVSLNPPIMLICVNRDATLHTPLLAGADFAINMLHGGQEEIARHCGGERQGEARFDTGDWQISDFGPPILADAQAYFICRQEQRVEHGTHSIFIGEVVAAYAGPDIDPLVYVDGKYLAPVNGSRSEQ